MVRDLFVVSGSTVVELAHCSDQEVVERDFTFIPNDSDHGDVCDCDNVDWEKEGDCNDNDADGIIGCENVEVDTL